jgi:thioredoxin 1
MSLIHLNDDNFNTEVNKSPAIVVDFWATWCGPCRALGPTIEKLADEFDGKVAIAKCNVDEANQSAAKWRIQSIPCIIAFRNGVEVGRVVGNNPPKVRELVESLL